MVEKSATKKSRKGSRLKYENAEDSDSGYGERDGPDAQLSHLIPAYCADPLTFKEYFTCTSNRAAQITKELHCVIDSCMVHGT